MRQHIRACPGVPVIWVILGFLLLINCGDGTRSLISIAVTPAAADATNFPFGLAQFTATGSFSRAPMKVTPLAATWTSSNGAIASVDNSGSAQCSPGVPAPMPPPPTGTVTITASAPVTPGSSDMVRGTAMFTCP